MVKTGYFCYVYNYYLIIHSGLRRFYIYLNYNESEAFHIQLTSTLKNKVDVTQDRKLQEHFCFPAFAKSEWKWMDCTLTCFHSTSFFYLKRSRKMWSLKIMWLTHSTESQWWLMTITMHEIRKLPELFFLSFFTFYNNKGIFLLCFRAQLFYIPWPSCAPLPSVTWSHRHAYNDPATCHGSRRSPEGFLLIGGPSSLPHCMR